MHDQKNDFWFTTMPRQLAILRTVLKPGISIALATYNGDRHLQEQLESFASQTRLPDELVAGDDGSQDRTLDILREFARAAPFPVIILPSGPRRGFADNFLRVSRACRHELIAFSDQDDIWLPAKLAKAEMALRQNGSLFCIHTSMLVDADLNPITLYRQGRHQRGVSGTRTFEPLAFNPDAGCGNAMMFHHSLLDVIPDDVRPMQPREDRRLGHDTWIYVLAAALGRISHIDEPLMLWRQHGHNTFGARKYSTWERFRGMFTVPIDDYRLHEKFYDEIAGAFAGAHAHLDATLMARILAAREKYQARRDHIRSRANIHLLPTPMARLDAFARTYLHKDGSGPRDRASRMTMLKDLFLGVLSMGRQIEATAP